LLIVKACFSTSLEYRYGTPEAYVPNLGSDEHGFPLLSGAGRLVIKDIIMLAGGLVIASDSAKNVLVKNNNH